MAGKSSKASGRSVVGLPTQLTAPSSSADIAAAAPRPVCPEIMTTGNGRRRMTFSRNAKPSIFGISTSRVITSGLSALTASRACKRIGHLTDDLDHWVAGQDSRDQETHRGRIVDDEYSHRSHVCLEESN